ncbi:MAG: FMN-binding protein [Acidimicrobiales bacterium]
MPVSASFTGTDIRYAYGSLQLQVTMTGTTLNSVSVVQDSAPDPRSQSINSQALPILTQEALSAQGVNIDVVSGATFTSNAFAQALQSALSMA